MKQTPSTYEDEEKRGPRRRGFITRPELQKRGLFCGCDYWVDMAAFKVRHPVELPDGRRFASWEAAFSGLKRS